jgi:hypothetical protein
VGLERGPLSVVSTSEDLLGRKSSGSRLDNKKYGRKGSAALTIPLSATVGTNVADKWRSQATEFVLLFYYMGSVGIAPHILNSKTKWSYIPHTDYMVSPTEAQHIWIANFLTTCTLSTVVQVWAII